MDDVRASVRVIECVAKLTHPGSDLIRFEDLLLFLNSQVRQCFSIDILHRNAAGSFVMHEVMYPDNMRMSEFEAALCLPLELIKHCMILNHQVGKKFQRDIALQFFIARQPDNSHSASPEDPDQRVTAKDFLSATEFTRCRAYEVACAFVTHFE